MTIRNRIPLKPLEIWENADVPAALDLEEKIIEKRDLNKSQEVVDIVLPDLISTGMIFSPFTNRQSISLP